MLKFRTLLGFGLCVPVLLGAVWSGCSSSEGGSGDTALVDVYRLTQQFDLSIPMSSTKFNETRRIPRTSSCERDDISPPIAWGDVPDGTVSLAVLVDSNQLLREEIPDLLWVHWVLWNIPSDAVGLPEAVPKESSVPSIGPRTGQGTNDDKNIGWSGPCKPALGIGWTQYDPLKNKQKKGGAGLISKYYFRLYALDIEVDLPGEATKIDFLRAIDGHILAGGELVGEFVAQNVMTK